MATDLFIIAKIKTSKEEVMSQKDIWLQQLKDLKLEHITVIGHGQLTGDWEYEFPTTYDDVTDSIIPDVEDAQLIYYSSPFVFNIRLYENCLELITIYKYNFIYGSRIGDFTYLFEFRNIILKILKIFNAEHEIIYLADNGCDKLSTFLELQVWEGVGYDDLKQNMINTGVPFTKDYLSLDYEKLRYSNRTEYVYDDFEDIKHPENINHQNIAEKFYNFEEAVSYSRFILEVTKDKKIALLYLLKAKELLDKEAVTKEKYRLYQEFHNMSLNFWKINEPKYAKICDQQWLHYEVIYFPLNKMFYNYFDMLIESGNNEYLFEIFEIKSIRNFFYEYFRAITKLFVDKDIKVYRRSLEIYELLSKKEYYSYPYK